MTKRQHRLQASLEETLNHSTIIMIKAQNYNFKYKGFKINNFKHKNQKIEYSNF